VQQCQQILVEWRAQMGLILHPEKTQITHTLHPQEENIGFNFLGFTVHQFLVGEHPAAHNAYGIPLGFKTLIQPRHTFIQRHQQKLKQILQCHQAATESQLIDALNPVIIGWSSYFSTVVSSHSYQGLDTWLYFQLKNWATHPHPHKSQRWIAHRYWLIDRGEGWLFAAYTTDGIQRLVRHSHTSIQQYVKVQGQRSVFNAITAFLDTLPDEEMAQARQMFFQVITERQAIGGTPLGSVTG
jgi:RNA-directed DNA polymerase